MKTPKILVASPTFDGMRYCINEFLRKILDLDYPEYDILIIENSESKDFFNELKESFKNTKINFQRVEADDNKNKNKMNKIVESRNKIIKYALENSYDYILMMDCDVIPPKDIIKDLISCNKDIVSGVYLNLFDNKVLPVAWMDFTPEEFEEIKSKGFFPQIKSIKDIQRHLTVQEVNTSEMFKVSHPSPGCMLISRKVFEKIRYGLFNLDEIYKKETKLTTSDDIYFIFKAKEAGFECFCYTKVKCDHMVGGKYKRDSQGNFVHPAFEK
jgi:GT2 family glycosyltransferase